jgi:hypothetical protein
VNKYEALKLLALRAVMKPDEAAHYRNICRWYSTTFHTPLHTVEELPEEDVLTAYYEATFEEMQDQERQEQLTKLLETEEERVQRQRAKDVEAAEAFEFARMLAAEAKREEAKAKIAEVKAPPKAPSMLSARDRAEGRLPESTPKPAFEKLEPDVSIKFVDAEEFEKELEGFGTMTVKDSK